MAEAKQRTKVRSSDGLDSIIQTHRSALLNLVDYRKSRGKEFFDGLDSIIEQELALAVTNCHK